MRGRSIRIWWDLGNAEFATLTVNPALVLNNLSNIHKVALVAYGKFERTRQGRGATTSTNNPFQLGCFREEL